MRTKTKVKRYQRRLALMVKADFEDDVGPSKNTRVVIIESDDEDD